MIRDHAQFEAALEEAILRLDAHPAEGTPEYERLLALMHDIAAYRPAVVPPPDATPNETERLARRLDAFEAGLPPHFTSHWRSMIGGDLRPQGGGAPD